jgi:hypothetical protein
MIPVYLVPALLFSLIIGSIGFYMKLSEDRDARRNRRP